MATVRCFIADPRKIARVAAMEPAVSLANFVRRYLYLAMDIHSFDFAMDFHETGVCSDADLRIHAPTSKG